MKQFLKPARIEKSITPTEIDLLLINKQALRPLSAEEVFVFKLAACGEQVDRDYERFTAGALEQMAEKFVGLPVLQDHKWSASAQTARVYAAKVEGGEGNKVLVLRCYMPRTDATADMISAIESGILRECSVGLAVGKALCSICGANQRETLCRHIGGREYDGKVCWFDLDEVTDAYEISFVAVPAQPGAGVTKSKRYREEGSPVPNPAEAGDDTFLLARAMQKQEELRYGGFEK